MLVEKEIQQILSQLAQGDLIKFSNAGSDMMICITEKDSKLFLTTLVYDGGNYIPPSIKLCLSRKSPFFHPSLLTFLTLDEQNFQVSLNYLGQVTPLDYQELKVILEEFGLLAEKWRLYLDEHGKNDLVYIKAK